MWKNLAPKDMQLKKIKLGPTIYPEHNLVQVRYLKFEAKEQWL